MFNTVEMEDKVRGLAIHAVDDIGWHCPTCKDVDLPIQLYLVHTLPEAQKSAKIHAAATGHKTRAWMKIEDTYERQD